MAKIHKASNLLVEITKEISEALLKADLNYTDAYSGEEPTGIGTWNIEWEDIKKDSRLCKVVGDDSSSDIVIRCSPEETIQFFSLLHIVQTEEQYVLIVNEMIKDMETIECTP